MRTTNTFLDRRRLGRGLVLGALLTGVLASSVSAATTQVEASSALRRFTPATVTPAVGGTVHWLASGTDDHSVTSNQQLFSSGAPTANLDFSRRFSAGTYPYHCEKHVLDGMRGTVRVAPQVVRAPVGLPFTVKWAAAGTNTGTRFDVQYRVGSGPWKSWKSNSSAKSAVFGKRSAPVRLVRGKTYSFRATSELGAARSSVSPVKSFRAR